MKKMYYFCFIYWSHIAIELISRWRLNKERKQRTDWIAFPGIRRQPIKIEMWHKSNLQSQKSSTVCVRNPILWHDKIGIYQNRIFRFELNSICLSGQNRCLKLAFKTSPISNISLNLCAGLSNMSSFKHFMWLWFDLRKSHQVGHPEADMRFVQNFILPDFQAKIFTPSISPNFNNYLNI